ncbi:hypothetical protein [Inhella gelatinilytica]|uniref:Uncharacterized protein n=1 Tax=Inhella gelatinilytica TaxID=2795030 RepID=A0A931NDG6_9BURK|nr:hypothetical protein [Inhella gelatinilytica]MBH9552215.1 hypothetical protein [Inhella gelatinilytica]
MPQFTSPRPALNLKPRNPWVAPAARRKAGAHQPAAPRQTDRRELARQLREFWTPPRST